VRKAVTSLLALLLLAWPVMPASRATQKKPAPAAKAQKTVKSGSSKTQKSSKSSSRRRSTRAAKSRRSGPPKQTEPSAQRYMEIQQALADRGYYKGEIDGKWGASCVEALKQFQEEQNLKPDGKLGALSLIALGLGPKREPVPAIPQFDSKPSDEQAQ
jgi:peptidoglycan hydrolase-like protein with peptidoglycan-binding domain